MKKILITVSEGSIARNILSSGFLEHFKEDFGPQIFILAPQEKTEFYKKEFSSLGAHIIGYSSASLYTFFDRVIFYLIRNCYYTESILSFQKSRLLVDHNYFAYLFKRLLVYILGGSALVHKLIRVLAGFRKPAKEILRIFKDIRPDLLFASDVQDESDLHAIASARKLGIKVIGMVRSWDNLTNGLVQVVPDLLLVWSPYIYKIATTLQHFPPKMVKIIGIPQYDWYVRKDIFISREDFLRQVGVDNAKKLILFAGIGDYLAPHEVEVAELADEAIKKGELIFPTNILFRPHPNFTTQREKIAALSNVVFDDQVAKYTSAEKTSWEMGGKEIAHLVNSLRHADLVITTASTMAIDAVAFAKPVICLAFDGKSKEPYQRSVLRYYRDYTHYKLLSATKGFKIAYDKNELVKHINDYLKDPTVDKKEREEIKSQFIWKLDGGSIERLAEVLKQNLD